MSTHLALPDYVPIGSAKLPATYEAAKVAITNCARIDECQEWANKAEALASYAKQADDDTLRQMADRIQARAIRRAGELLKQFDARGDHRKKDGTVLSSATQMARSVGLSERQQKTAVRVANVPAETFEKAIESENPPTVTKLAEMGKQSRPASITPAPQYPTPPRGFKQATHVIGVVREFAAFCAVTPPELVANGVMPSEVEEIRNLVGHIDGWLDRFVVNLGGKAA